MIPAFPSQGLLRGHRSPWHGDHSPKTRSPAKVAQRERMGKQSTFNTSLATHYPLKEVDTGHKHPK